VYRTKVIMVMGNQRSGTNALFRSLSGVSAKGSVHETPSLVVVNEDVSNPLFDDYFLRPAREVRPWIMALDRPLIMKPISETKTRTALEVAEEYADFDLKVACIYRDPVNVFYSTLMHWPTMNKPKNFVKNWKMRNIKLLDLCRSRPDISALVRYEDLVKDRYVFKALCGFLGITGAYMFRKDSNAGRKNLTGDVIGYIDREAGGFLGLMDKAKTYRAGQALAV